METVLGKWELMPALTEHFEAFSDKMGLPEETRQLFRNMVTVVTIRKDGNALVSTVEVKGQPTKQELKFFVGVPLDYDGLDGSKMTTCLNIQGGKFLEKHKSVKDGVTREWDVERHVEGDTLISISTKDGVSMKSKMKKV